AIDEPPMVGSLGLAPAIANPSTFAPPALASIVSATLSAGPFSVLLLSCAHAHPLAQSNPPYTSTPLAMVTASPNGALAHAYTRLPPALSSAFCKDLYGCAIVPSSVGPAASACANTPHASTTFLLLGSPAQSDGAP